METHVHELRIATRWPDFDALGHLTHSVVFAFLDEARDAVLTPLVGDFDAWPSVVARVAADFRREIPRGPRELVVRSRIVEVGRSSVRFEQQLLDAGGEVAVSAEAVVVAFDPETRTARAISDEHRVLLTRAG